MSASCPQKRATLFIFALASLIVHCNAMQAQATRCSGAPPARQKQVREFQQRVEAGPFYKELLLRLGEPKRCEAKLSGTNITLSYAFRDGAHLDASISPDIEYSAQHAQFRGLDAERALALLKQSERDSFGQDGCGIDWHRQESQSKEEHSTSRAVVYRGSSCNCQARILYSGNAVVGLALSSSC